MRKALTELSPLHRLDEIPDRQATFDFVFNYWKYLKFRKEYYNEVLSGNVIKAQIRWLADEPDPISILAITIHNKIKNLRPIDSYGKKQYKLIPTKERYAFRCHRADRQGTKAEINDTVFAPRGQCFPKLKIVNRNMGI